MGGSFSPIIFLYGMALVVGVAEAFTLTIWRALPKTRPGFRGRLLKQRAQVGQFRCELIMGSALLAIVRPI